MASAQQRKDFIAAMVPIAQEIQKKYGIPVSVTIAQAIQETGYGEHVVGNNYFGIKGKGSEGSVNANTREVINGQSIHINDHFAAYGGMADSAEGYAKFLLNNGRYQNAFQHVNDPDEFIKAVHRAGYATDPNYSNAILDVIASNNLTQYDDPETAKNFNYQRSLEFAKRQAAGESMSADEIEAERKNRRGLLDQIGYSGNLADADIMTVAFFVIMAQFIGKALDTQGVGSQQSAPQADQAIQAGAAGAVPRMEVAAIDHLDAVVPTLTIPQVHVAQETKPSGKGA